MDLMGAAFGILVLVLFCLAGGALAGRFELQSGLLPLPLLGLAAVWLLLFGMAGALAAGAWSFLALLLAVGLFGLSPAHRQETLAALRSPALLFFVGMGSFFWLLFALRQPMFVEWDEFTFWGTACKMVKTQNMLFPGAPGNLAARAYLPGMMLLSYLFQLVGAWAEWKAMAAYAMLFFAAMAACAALPKRRWAAAVLLLLGGFLIPFFCAAPEVGAASKVFLNVMGDLPLAMGFGGAACVYLGSGRRLRGLVLTGASLCLLTLIKDMGLAYALILVGVIFLDRCVTCPRYSLRSFAAQLLPAVGLALPVAACFVGWSRYCALTASIDRNSVGSAGISYGGILVGGLRQLVGIDRTETFARLMELMARALVEVKVCLLGSGVVMLAVLLLIHAAAWLAAPYGKRRRVALIFAAFLAAFAVFYVFHLFLYYYNFAEVEALALKDYTRYIGPYYQGWLLVGLCLLGQSLQSEMLPRLSRLALVGAVGCMTAVVLWRGIPSAGFLSDSGSRYTVRQDVAQRAAQANALLDWDDRVLVISQGDNATRWYYYNYELNATVVPGFGGYCRGPDEQLDQWQSTFMNLVEAANWELYDYQAVCTRPGLQYYLEAMACTHILIDGVDAYFLREFGEMFTVELPSDMGLGAQLFAVTGQGDEMRLIPAEEVSP